MRQPESFRRILEANHIREHATVGDAPVAGRDGEASTLGRYAAAPATIVKQCSCGWAYTREQWGKLRSRGVQRFNDPNTPDLDLRDCSHCRSTIAIEVSHG